MIGCHLEVALPASCCTAASDVLHYVNAIGSSRVYTVAESTRVSYERRTCNSFAPKAHLDSVRVLRMSRCRSRVLTAGHMCTGDIDRSPLIEAGICSIAANAPRKLRVSGRFTNTSGRFTMNSAVFARFRPFMREHARIVATRLLFRARHDVMPCTRTRN